jgi:Mrp family chromosome partitioning ATPase
MAMRNLVQGKSAADVELQIAAQVTNNVICQVIVTVPETVTGQVAEKLLDNSTAESGAGMRHSQALFE